VQQVEPVEEATLVLVTELLVQATLAMVAVVHTTEVLLTVTVATVVQA
jgi:hypothetical protein